MQTLSSRFGKGGTGLTDGSLKRVLEEVRGLTVKAAAAVTSHAFAITAISDGTGGNTISTVEGSSPLSWGAATLGSGTNGKEMILAYFNRP